jgi:hypothetical protein
MGTMMEAASTSETSVNYYQITRRNNPEDSHLHTHRCEKLRSHWILDTGYPNKRWKDERVWEHAIK